MILTGDPSGAIAACRAAQDRARFEAFKRKLRGETDEGER